MTGAGQNYADVSTSGRFEQMSGADAVYNGQVILDAGSKVPGTDRPAWAPGSGGGQGTRRPW